MFPRERDLSSPFQKNPQGVKTVHKQKGSASGNFHGKGVFFTLVMEMNDVNRIFFFFFWGGGTVRMEKTLHFPKLADVVDSVAVYCVCWLVYLE